MSCSVLRTTDAWWVLVPDGSATRVDTAAATTAALLADRAAVHAALERAATGDAALVDVADLDLVSPVTAPCRVVAQMTNYRSHVRDAGLDPEHVPLTFFRKTSGSISGPLDDVVRPAHVRLLDHEVEVGLVIGEPLEVGDDVGPADLERHVAALVVTNDVSARDLQLPKTQFYESKSYPTFTPVGPVLLLLDPGDLARFGDLRLRLSVDGEVRQDAIVEGDLLYSPLEALRALAGFQRLDPGDLLLTGTPVGTALSAPPKPVELVGALLPAHVKWRIFLRRQESNPRYLQDGQLLEVSIRTDDGALDLGTQRTRVRFAR